LDTAARNLAPLPARSTAERAELVRLLSGQAKLVRKETVRLSRIAGAGHYIGTFSAAELFAALYYAQLRYRPAEPDWPDRDRFVLSKRHAAIGLYPVLADVGFFDPAPLDDYTRLGSAFGDHPDMRKVPGIDFSSGSLGHGLSVALGITLAARVQGRSYRTYCLLGDGELAIEPPSGCRFRTRCWKAQEICGTDEPALIDRGGGHPVACHFAQLRRVSATGRPDAVAELRRAAAGRARRALRLGAVRPGRQRRPGQPADS